MKNLRKTKSLQGQQKHKKEKGGKYKRLNKQKKQTNNIKVNALKKRRTMKKLYGKYIKKWEEQKR